MGEYNILNQKITFSESAERYIALNFSEVKDYMVAAEHFDKFYYNCGNIENVLSRYGDETEEILLPIIKRHFDSLLELEIYDVGSEEYINGIPHNENADNAYDEILYKFSTIEGNQEAAANMRAARKASRGRVVGGGFGVGGALKGMATAGAMNIGTGLAHSAVNVVGNIGSAINASMEKSALYKDDSTKNTLLDGIYLLISTEYEYYADLLREKIGIDYFNNDFDEHKSKALLENADRVNEDKSKEFLVQAISLYPLDNVAYEYIVETYGDCDNAVQEMAEKCCPFTDIKALKIAKIENQIRKIDFANKENIQNAINSISELCKMLGVPADKYISAFEQIIRKYNDIESKVDGINYDTPEEVKTAREERDMVIDIINKNIANDENALLCFKEKIEKEFSSLAKDKYLDFINKELSDYDLRYRTVEGKVYDTRDEADYARNSLNKLATLMKDSQITSLDGILELKTNVEQATTSDIKEPYLKRCDLLCEIWNESEELCSKYSNGIDGSRAEKSCILSHIQLVLDKMLVLNIQNQNFTSCFLSTIRHFKKIMDTNYDSIIQATDKYYERLAKARKYEEYLQQKNEKKSFFGKIKSGIQGVAEKFNESSYNFLSQNGTKPLPDDNISEWNDVKHKCLDCTISSKTFAEKEKNQTTQLTKTIEIKQKTLKTDGLIIPDDIMSREYIHQQLNDILTTKGDILFSVSGVDKKQQNNDGNTNSNYNTNNSENLNEIDIQALEELDRLDTLKREGNISEEDYLRQTENTISSHKTQTLNKQSQKLDTVAPVSQKDNDLSMLSDDELLDMWGVLFEAASSSSPDAEVLEKFLAIDNEMNRRKGR